MPDAADLDPVVMQRIAREMNVSETAFVLPSQQADFRLRWWTPTVEVPLCGHATVAACHALVEMGRLRVPGSHLQQVYGYGWPRKSFGLADLERI